MIQVSEAEIKRVSSYISLLPIWFGVFGFHSLPLLYIINKQAQKAEKEEMMLKGTMRKRMEFLDLD